MGTWGLGPFDDDTAMDFIDDLRDGSPEHVAGRLEQAVAEAADVVTLKYGPAVRAVASAALLGGRGLPPALTAWRESLAIRVDSQLARTALAAIDRSCSPQSELWELWTEAGKAGAAWRALADTRTALSAIAYSAGQTDALF